MAIKDLFSLPMLLAAAGGFAAYRYLGKKGKERYYWTAGGAAAGYGAGKFLQGIMAKALPAALPPQQVQATTLENQPQPLPPEQQLAEYAPMQDRGQVLDRGSIVDVMNDQGSYNGTGDSGFGSYAPSLNGDVDLDEVFKDAGLKPS